MALKLIRYLLTTVSNKGCVTAQPASDAFRGHSRTLNIHPTQQTQTIHYALAAEIRTRILNSASDNRGYYCLKSAQGAVPY